MPRHSTWLLLISVLGAGCSVEPEQLAPYGEVVVHVDTDLPAPTLAGRIRIDLYDESGRWFESRDLARPNADDWPLSFGVWVQEPARRRVWVRLRVYPQGKLRTYRGERYQDWPEVLGTAPAGTGTPLLLYGEQDATPATEPEPLVTIDRLVLLEIPPEQKLYAAIVLRGVCVGTMANLAREPGRGPVLDEAASCVGEAQERNVVEPEPLQAESPAGPPQRGTWAHEPCGEGEGSVRACIPGGAMLLGNRGLLMSDVIDAAPERIIAIQRFWIDRREVSVGDIRAALQAGFSPPGMPVVHDGPLAGDEEGSCTYTSIAADREEYPLSCVDWATARAYCHFLGGDLPTEAQWEYVATAAGHPHIMPFPWGEEDPTCDSVVFGRAQLGDLEGYCAEKGLGPVPFGEGDSGDVTPLGVGGLAGRVSEWARDGGTSYSAPCWADAVVNPWCDPDGQEHRAIRGGAWASPMPTLIGTFRLTRSPAMESSMVGFRCVAVEP